MGKLETDAQPIDVPGYGLVTLENVMTACRTGDMTFITALLSVPHATLNHPESRTGLTPLHYAAAYDARKVVVALVNSGRCDLHAADQWGRTAARLAYEVANDPALGRYLLKKQYAPPKVQAPPPGVIPFPGGRR